MRIITCSRILFIIIFSPLRQPVIQKVDMYIIYYLIINSEEKKSSIIVVVDDSGVSILHIQNACINQETMKLHLVCSSNCDSLQSNLTSLSSCIFEFELLFRFT